MNNYAGIPWYKDIRWLLGIIVAIAAIVTPIIIYRPAPDFNMTIDPLTGGVKQGSTIETSIKVEGLKRYVNIVSLTSSGQPTGVTVSFAPSEGVPTYKSNLKVYVGQDTPIGDYEIAIRGIGADGKERSCKYLLTIIAKPLAPKVEITYPINNATVELREIVKGTSQNIPDGQVLWILIYPHEINRYYPQNKSVEFQAQGNWASPTLIGIENDVNKKFDIVAVLADEFADEILTNYLNEAAKMGIWLGLEILPEGALIHDRVTAIRSN